MVARSGDLRDRVTFERRSEATDDYGNEEAAWAEIVSSRAACLEPTRGGEQIIAGRLAGVSAFDLWVRSDSETRTLQAGDRAKNARTGETYNIRWIGDLDGKNAFLLLQVEAGVAT